MAFFGLLLMALAALLVFSGWTNYSLPALFQGRFEKRG